jgi:two-component system response regulator AtoC
LDCVSRSILIVDDEENVRHMLAIVLRDAGYRVAVAADATSALKALAGGRVDVVVSDVRMPGLSGLDLLDAIRSRGIETTVILMSAYGNFDSAIEAVKKGAYDYIAKPFKTDEVLLVLRKAEEREKLRGENRALRRTAERVYGTDAIVGESGPVKALRETILRVAGHHSTVLVVGESGVGKELVARAIHLASRRAAFVAVNCGAIPEALIESELFGHEKGAFTDAVRLKHGLFEEAHGGTLFLDEIGELPMPLQVKLLRVLEEEAIRRVGGTEEIPIDVRVVAATQRDLEAEVKRGAFREDLFYRLNVVTIEVPPLRARPDDIPRLVQHFAAKLAERGRTKPIELSPGADEVLQRYPWPGNVRELQNVIERLFVMCEAGDAIDVLDLPEKIRTAAGARPRHDAELSVKRATRELEARLIREALQKTGGNRTAAAKLLDLSHRALLYKIRDFGLE